MKDQALDPVISNAVVFSIERCLARHGVTVAVPTVHESQAIASYWMAAADALGDDLTLQIAREIPIGALGLASYGIISAATLGEALATLGNYLAQIVPTTIVRVLPADLGRVDVQVTCEDPVLGPLLEELLIARLQAHGTLLVSSPTSHAVGLRRPAPRIATAAWRAYFGVLPRFGQRQSVLRLSASDLDLGLRTANPDLQAVVRATVTRTEDTSTTARVRAYVRSHVREAIAPAAVALALGITRRTLQRRLHDEQTSIREIATVVRIEVARELLEHTETPIADVAVAVGFSQPTSFSRAFVTATSETPQAYRKRHQE